MPSAPAFMLRLPYRRCPKQSAAIPDLGWSWLGPRCGREFGLRFVRGTSRVASRCPRRGRLRQSHRCAKGGVGQGFHREPAAPENAALSRDPGAERWEGARTELSSSVLSRGMLSKSDADFGDFPMANEDGFDRSAKRSTGSHIEFGYRMHDFPAGSPPQSIACSGARARPERERGAGEQRQPFSLGRFDFPAVMVPGEAVRILRGSATEGSGTARNFPPPSYGHPPMATALWPPHDSHRPMTTALWQAPMRPGSKHR